tara:strand:+ start:585 stop:995 length:411 start_codon:yes stop_codon:yes gene_type:complete
MIRIGRTCISSTTIVMIVLALISSTVLIASILNSGIQEGPYGIIDMEEKDTTAWIPTKEDIAYQDSMFSIVEQTSMDVDTIKEAIDRILYKLERLEYADGTSDSIRYEEGSAMDIKRNYPDEERMWVSGDGDTIWE